MRKSKLCAIILTVLGIGLPKIAHSQGQTTDFKWIGNSISTVIGNTDPDMNTVYLYNVGAGKYLNIGSYWGTCVSAYNVGIPITISHNGSYYQMEGNTYTPEGKQISFGRRKDTNDTNPVSWNRVYCDRGPTNGIPDWTFTETNPGSKTYTIHCFNDEQGYNMYGNRYLHVTSNGGNSSSFLDLDYPTTVDPNDKNSQWKIVTLKDLKDAFKDQFASNESPADATFLIADQNFGRSNMKVEKWVTEGFTKHMIDRYRFYSYAQYTFYIGMGAFKSDGYQTEYGRYWIGSVKNGGFNNNNNANGTMTQTVTLLKKGWYRVSCDGFYSAGSGSNLKASIFANIQNAPGGQSNVSASLNRFNNEFTYELADLTKVYTPSDVNTKSPYVKAAELFEQGKYNNSILVYSPTDNAQLNIGIKVEGSTHQLDWTAFDNFQLKYCGNNDLILDEMQTSVDYMTKQVNANNAYTLILKRTMTPGLWSSITLPVNLTAAQFKTAFGDQAKLSELVGQDSNIPSRINFKSVSLANDNDVVINPNKLYIMKSTRNANVTSGSYSKIIETGTTITVQAPYFVINNVVLATTPSAIFKEDSKPSTTTDAKLQFCGTQINQTTNIVPANSYVLGANDGKWYFTQSALPIKGFRCWIATGNNAVTKDLKFFIDGVEEGETTGIEGLTFESTDSLDGTVYNINGQVVRRNATSLEGLPKGIYIINNKKYIVK